jgi:hypothetical protein
MPKKSIEERAAASFASDEVAEAKEYIRAILESWKDISRALVRTTALILFVITIFELLGYSTQGKSFSVSGIPISNTSLVQKSLPVVVGYLVFDACLLTGRWLEHSRAFFELTQKFTPKVAANDLDYLIRPILPTYWTVGFPGPRADNELTSERFASYAVISFGILTIFVFPLAFEAQAYLQLVDKYGTHDLVVWISLGLSVALLIVSAIYVLIEQIEPPRRKAITPRAA